MGRAIYAYDISFYTLSRCSDDDCSIVGHFGARSSEASQPVGDHVCLGMQRGPSRHGLVHTVGAGSKRMCSGYPWSLNSTAATKGALFSDPAAGLPSVHPTEHRIGGKDLAAEQRRCDSRRRIA